MRIIDKNVKKINDPAIPPKPIAKVILIDFNTVRIVSVSIFSPHTLSTGPTVGAVNYTSTHALSPHSGVQRTKKP